MEGPVPLEVVASQFGFDLDPTAPLVSDEDSACQSFQSAGVLVGKVLIVGRVVLRVLVHSSMMGGAPEIRFKTDRHHSNRPSVTCWDCEMRQTRWVDIASGIAIGISAVALVVAAMSMRYTRRQAHAAETANWLTQPMSFEVTVIRPNSSTSRLAVLYVEGPTLTSLDCGLLVDDDSPFAGFGVGVVSGSTSAMGAIRVGEHVELPVVQRVSPDGGPLWAAGVQHIRFVAEAGGKTREIASRVDVPDTRVLY